MTNNVASTQSRLFWLHNITLHYITLPYITSHDIALHTLHTLNFIHYITCNIHYKCMHIGGTANISGKPTDLDHIRTVFGAVVLFLDRTLCPSLIRPYLTS